ncbi:MAG: LamG-like jellyroll fold domain-containing protein, partial [Pseudomonadota bacterium]
SNSIPAPIAYWDFGTSVDGATVDALGGPPAKAYTLYENQALLRTDGIVAGPKGELNALSFNGEDEFAYISHDTSVQITQGTIALWFKPEDVDDFSIFLSKDQQGSGDGGHFRLGHTEKGGLFLRMAEGDGGSNHAWKTNKMLTEDKWHHIAVTFTEDGVRVLLDGKLVPASKWSSVEGNVKSPNTYTEAFLLMNQEPWVLGADQANTEFNNSAQEFGIDNENLSREFKGAIADVAVFGGFNSTDALTTAEVKRIAKSKVDIGEIEGPSGQQPMVAADDVFSGGGGKDSIYGGAGDDSLYGGGGSDSIEGGYGDDVIDGGAGNDKLDGGRGSDLLIGGIGNDILYARSDAGEDRAAQMFLDTGNQRDPAYIDLEYSKLHDWIDQPLVADDILVGGAGKDHFLIELQINGTLDAIMDNLLDDGRTIRWHGVAGENQFVHEHWVDSIGVDIIADFNASEDKISVLGHTTNIDIDYKSHDSNGDGQADSIVSIITAYSQQGGGGGAHDEDYLGYIVVHGDLVTEEMVTTDAGVHFGIVETIDDLQEALAPSGETKTRSYEGAELFGYDSRDVEGDPIGSDPEAFSENPFKDLVTFADKTLADLPKLTILMTDAGGTFDGTQYGAIAHDASYQRNNGTISFSFKADSPGGRDQALLSKDHAGHKDGGHFTAWISSNGFLLVRFQDEKNNSRFLKYHDERIIAGQEYHVAFSFTKTTLSLFVNGEMVDADDGFRLGMIGNTEEILVGASARQRIGDDDRAEWLFDGEITNIAFMSRPLDQIETILLSEAGGAVAALSADVAPPPSDNVPSEPAPTGKPIGGTNSNDTIKGTEDGETIKAKSGNDNVSARSGGDDVYGGRGDDKLRGGDGDDDVYGERGNDRVYGDDGDDDVFGDQGNDRVDGGDGDDEVYGGDGSDFVAGGDGDDLVAGGKGIDKLYGGDGEDQFFFAEFGEENVDRIYGFKLSDDVIALDEDVFTAIDGDNIDASLFLGTVAGSETEKLIYDKKRGEVFYDADGSGNAEAELVARVNRNLDLTEDHFVLT